MKGFDRCPKNGTSGLRGTPRAGIKSQAIDGACFAGVREAGIKTKDGILKTRGETGTQPAEVARGRADRMTWPRRSDDLA